MSKEQIISKGKYSYEQPDTMIGVKQYLFVKEDGGKKRLLLRFVNNRQEKCTKFAFILYRLDAKGNVLGTDKFESADREYGEKEVFSFDRKIAVEERCCDFKVQMVYARYGNYTYHVENNDVSVSYSERNTSTLNHANASVKAKPRKINGRSFDMPWIFVVLSLIILALAFAACGFLLNDFMEREVDFTLSGVDYQFVDKEKKTDVIITGCASSYREIKLVSNIEGHKVVGIAKDAFVENDNIVKLEIDGINIPARGFEGCSELETVIIKNVTSIGAGAFEDCDALESVTVTEGKKNQLLSIGSGAFADCGALKTVEIDQTIVYGSRVDYFKDSEGIETLKLRNLAYTMKDVYSAYVTRIASLFDVSTSSVGSLKLKELSIDYMDSVPAGFVRGFKRLQSVEIGSSEIKTVGEYAFEGCTSLTSFNAKGKLQSIGAYAFSGTDITSVDMSKVSTLGIGAFKNASKLSSVTGFGEGGLDNVPVSTFEGCVSLTSFTLHKDIKHIFSSAFAGSGLVKFSIPEGVSYDLGILKGCSNLKELELYQLGSAGYVGMLFGADKNSKSAEIAKLVPTSLKTISLSYGEVINESAFKGCSGVTTINLPVNIVAIGKSAFSGCTSLTVVDIPADSTTLKTIGEEAFAGCEKLKYVPLLDSIVEIGSGALKGCIGIESLNLPFLGRTPAVDSQETVSYIYGGSVPATLKEIALLDSSITKLPTDAFKGCSKVQKITIPNTISVIGEGAFENCKALISVGLSDGSSGGAVTADLKNITDIGVDAFNDCEALSSVTLSENLKTIGDGAFAGSGISYLEIPSSVTFIGLGIVEGCESMSSFTVPYLGTNKNDNGQISYFFGSNIPKSLKSITVHEFKDNTIGTDAFANCTGVTSFGLPQGIAHVGESAFENCTSLTSFDFDTIESIGDKAFYGCDALKTADLRNVKTIGNSAFYGCKALTKCVLTNATSLGGRAFYGCVELTLAELGQGVTTIGKETFAGCTKLANVTFGDVITSIGSKAFYETAIEAIELPEGLTALESEIFAKCTKLVRVTLPSTLTTIGDNAFEGSAITSVKIPERVYYIGSCAFKDTPLTSLVIPSGVTDIGASALSGCNSITALELPYVSSFSGTGVADYLYNGAFPEKLKSITLNACHTGSIYDQAFADSGKLEEVIMKSGVNYIGYNAFSGCSELRYVYIPSEVTSIAYNAFEGCYRLYEISKPNDYYLDVEYVLDYNSVSEERAPTVEKDGYKFALYNNEWYLINYPKGKTVSPCASFSYYGETISSYKVPSYLFYNDDTVTKVVLPSSVTSVGARAFGDCESLATVELSKNITSIGNYAFASCTALEKVTFPRELKIIGEYAFYNCEKLNNVKLYENVASIGANAFSGCQMLFDVYCCSNHISPEAGSFGYGGVARRAVKVHTDMDEASSVEVKISGKGTFRTSGSAWLLIKGENIASVNLGDFTYNGTTVSSYRVAEKAFEDCDTVKNVIIGNQVKQLQARAFYDCDALESLNCADNRSLTEIEEYAFASCSALRTANLPSSVKVIGNSAFEDCYRLLSVDMPVSLTTIGSSAFEECARLLSVTLNSEVSSIGEGAFYGCDYLLEVYDLSSYINVQKGSSAYGRVAENAAAVYTSTAYALNRKEQNGLKFIEGNGTWYLYDFEDKNASVLTVPNIGSKMVIIPYAIVDGSFKGVVLPTTLYAVKNRAFYNCQSFDHVYYMGDSNDWYEIDGRGNVPYSQHLYYKQNCVHYDTEGSVWTYVNNEVSTKRCAETSQITTAPTCYSAGYKTFYCSCPGCGYTRQEVVEIEHEFENNVCKNCGETKTAVTDTSLQAYIDKGVITVNSFAYDTNKKGFVSQNKQIYSSASFTITANQRMTLIFTVKTSSTSFSDYMRISKNFIDGDKHSGNSEKTYEVVLYAGDTLTFTYVKNGTGASSSAYGLIKDLQIVEKIEQQSK